MEKEFRILILEDLSADAELIEWELRKAQINFSARRVETRATFLQALKAWRPDAILADYILPQFSALEALQLLQAEGGEEIPFIMVTGTQSEEVAVACMKQGVDDYVLKASLRRLPSALLNALKKKEAERQREAAIAALRHSEEQYRLITEHTSDLIFMIDGDGRFLYVSPSSMRLLGYDPEELAGKDPFPLVAPQDREAFTRFLQEALLESEAKTSEFRYLHKNGGCRILESVWNRILDEKGEPHRAVVVSRDITEKKAMESQFLRAQRMESVGTLASGIAHDLNNVLTPITTALGMLQSRCLDHDSQGWIRSLERNVQRGIGLVRQVLSFVRGAAGEHEPLDLGHLLLEMEKFIHEAFPRSIRLQIHLPEDLWIISGNATQLHQVLLNLCVNARDAMPNGGSLGLSAENHLVDEHFARLHMDAKVGPYVAITVSDTGAGIPVEIIDRIFEPFFTTKETGKGTGLGLSTVFSIVKGHCGFMTVSSEAGRGAEFKVYLPVTKTLAARRGSEKKLKVSSGHGELILVVDDEPTILDLTQAALEQYGYRAITAHDGAEAIALYAQNRKETKAILMDMMMPVMDGPAAIRALRKIDPEVKIIAASGSETEEKLAELCPDYVRAFLPKPYTTDKLLATLQHILTPG